MNASQLSSLKSVLWPRDMARPVPVFAVLDCARSPAVYELVQRSYREKACLFAGDLDPVLRQAAPHLLRLEPRDGVTDELLLHGWRDFWFTLLRVDASFAGVRRHLRTFLRVTDETRSTLLFRFYDPRVLRRFLPTGSPDQLATMFHLDGLHYLTPDHAPTQALDFCCEDGKTLSMQALRLTTDDAVTGALL